MVLCGRGNLLGSMRESIVDGAKLIPSSRRIGSSDGRDVLGEDDREAHDQMPVNVAMHDPRARVVGGEANGDVVAGASQADDVALDGVDKVRSGLASCADNAEDVAMQMHGVGASRCATRHADLNDLVARKDIDASGGEQVLGSACARQDLEEDRNAGLDEGCTVDCELTTSKGSSKIDVDIRSSDSGNTRGGGVGERDKVVFDQWVGVGILSRDGVNIGCSNVSQDGGVDATGEASRATVGV